MTKPTNPSARFIGLDLGGTNIKSALVEIIGDEAQVVRTASLPTLGAEGPEPVTARIIESGKVLIGEGGARGVGMAVPGVFDRIEGTIGFLPNLAGWEGFPLRARLEEAFDLPVTLINDSQAFALAEARLGAGREAVMVVAMTLGTGIGGGIVIDGRLHLGAFGSAGEFGHQTIDPDGAICGCGNPGCLEALARPPVIASSIGAKDFEVVMERFGAGDAAAVEAVERMARYLGVGIANLFTILGPDRVVLGGGVAQAGPPFFRLVRAAVKERARLVPSELIEIVPAELGVDAGAIGAALTAAVRGG